MVDLGKYDSPSITGTISQVEVTTLRKYLEARHGAKAPKILKKFNDENLDRKHLVVFVESNGTTVDWFTMLPKLQGYMKSNLKAVKERNNLPNDTKDWIGKPIELKVNQSGFLRVAV